MEAKARKLACGDMLYRLVLEGHEGCDYTEEFFELNKLMQAGQSVVVIAPPYNLEHDEHDGPRAA